MYRNICNFSPKSNSGDLFNVINIVCETKWAEHPELSVNATYRTYIIVSGQGVLRCDGGERPLREGDVLITPPSWRYAVENAGGLVAVYASYLGVRANTLAESYKIGSVGRVFSGYAHLIPIWLSLLEKTGKNASVCCEGVVLYTYSEIGEYLYRESAPRQAEDTAEAVKAFIDAHFTDSELGLEMIGDALSYHPKYISSVFARKYRVSVNKYIRTIRVQHACALIDEGLSSVKDIAALSGYRDQLYFSSVFKGIIGVSPREHIAEIRRRTDSNTTDSKAVAED